MSVPALQLAPTARLAGGGDGFSVIAPRRWLERAQCTAGERHVIERLAVAPCEEPQLAEEFAAIEGSEHLPRFYLLLFELDAMQALSRVAMHDGRPLAALHPCDGFTFDATPLDATRPCRVSRFAMLAREDAWTLRSPLGHARLALTSDEAVRVVTALCHAGDVPSIATRTNVDPAAVRSVMELALAAGAIAPVDAEGRLEEDRCAALQQWEPHDLLFHAQSRLGRHHGKFGGTFRFRELIPPLPALRAPCGASIALHRPELSTLVASDPPFAAVLERRASIRQYGEPTAAQLGELLFRVARVKEVRRRDDMEIAFYNYPAGGARSELVFYPVVRRCSGLEPALYRYDGVAHALERVAPLDAHAESLLADAAAALGHPAPPILLLIAARFQRVSWKYESMAYAAMLKHVGVVLQTLYLAATAMNLAGCAIGGGDSDRFAALAGTRYYEETTVGEFALGTLP